VAVLQRWTAAREPRVWADQAGGQGVFGRAGVGADLPCGWWGFELLGENNIFGEIVVELIRELDAGSQPYGSAVLKRSPCSVASHHIGGREVVKAKTGG